MILEIFTDEQQKNNLVSNILIEDTTYFLKITPHDSIAIAREVQFGSCSNYIFWIPNNEIGRLRFHNIIGEIEIFGYKFQVKSKKFLPTQTEEDPLRIIIDDIAIISSEFIFSPTAAPSEMYGTNTSKLTSNLYYIYKYLMGNLFRDNGSIFQKYMDFVIENPTFVQRTTPEKIDVFLAKRYTSNTFTKLVQQNSDSLRIPFSHELMRSKFINALPKASNGDGILPRKILSAVNRVSYDTQENRFILHFLKWCISIFQSMEKYSQKYQVKENCVHATKLILRYVQNPLFQTVGVLSNISYASSALINRTGYKEIFHHYLRCRESPTLFIDVFNKQYLMMEIKDISQIYEYWVFFKVAQQLFDKESTLKIFSSRLMNGKFSYGLVLSDTKKKLFYNRTYKRSTGQSYSFNFRPDISLEIKREKGTTKFFFDAKYSNSITSSGKEIQPSYKNENIVKMLSYLESIRHSEAAVIVYPGTDFIFYEKVKVHANVQNANKNVYRSPKEIVHFKGVGAVPLSPGDENSDDRFACFMDVIKQKIDSIV